MLLAAVAFIAAGCGTREGGDPDRGGPFTRKEAASFAAAEVAIERLRKSSDGPVDWDRVAREVAVAMPVVRRIDAAAGTGYAAEINAALDRCRAGTRPRVNQQVIAKGLQHVAVLAIGQCLDGGAATVAAAFFEGIRPTFTRRDRDFFDARPTLEAEADAAFAEIAAAAAPGEAVSARRRLDRVIRRTYGLCVLYEIQQVEKLRDSDRPACAVKRKEAAVFYRIIADRVRKNAPRAHYRITAMLDGDYETMDAGALAEALRSGLGAIPLR